MKVRLCLVASVVLAAVLGSSSSSFAKSKGDGYRKSEIADARYGTGLREKLLKKAYGLDEELNKRIFGQEAAIAVMKAKLIQWLEGYPNRSGEPVMLNMIGLPGVGKSGMIEYLKSQGFPIAEFDAQTFVQTAGRMDAQLSASLINAIHDYRVKAPDTPELMIMSIEELDKLVEKNPQSGAETSSSAIGTMNTISSEGKINIGGGKSLPVSNIMFITTMNLSPSEIESFSLEVLKVEKSYYDFTIEDFAKFDDWIRNQASARYKVLAKMFRSNTVGRFGVNTIIMQPLGTDTYKRIIELQVERAIRQNVSDKNAAKRVTVDVHPSVVEFLLRETVYAPSGARETVNLSSALVEQLISFGVKATGPGVTSVDRPRHIEIRYHEPTDGVYIRVTEKVLKPHSTTEVREGNAIAFQVRYSPSSRMFLMPENIQSVKPASMDKLAVASTDLKPVTKKETFEARFPKSQDSTKGMREYIGQHIYGQSEAIGILATDFENYFGRQGPAKKEPSSRALAGFPGIGKSELFLRAAEYTKLPIVRINMQNYTANSAEAVQQFGKAVHHAIEQATTDNPSGKFLLLLEELDKVFEINPDGKLVDRPIMAKIKDLLNDGKFDAPTDYSYFTVDARGAFVGISMNFSVDRFGFEADPRMTSIDDVTKAWKKLSSSVAAIKRVLGSMFLPDTVSRLMTQLTIMKPLDRSAYQKIIDGQSARVRDTRLLDKDGRNVGQIELKTTASYRRYLFSESVIPSEGGRNTVKSSSTMVSTDLEYALARLPRSSRYAKEPLTVTLDYSEAKQKVRYAIQLTNQPGDKPLRLEDRPIALRFPSTKLKGRVEENRVHTAAHEFGHAFTSVQVGRRFSDVVVVESVIAQGYVQPNDKGSSAADMLAGINMILASRAFERIFMSPNPLSSSSVLDITSGPSQDIRQATAQLYAMLHQLGMNPSGGTLDRNFNLGMGKYASIEDMPAELADKLGLLLRDMEDAIVRETLEEHSRDWYVEKISTLARAGAMTEKEFYSLIGRKLPAANQRSVGTINHHFRSLFEKVLLKPSKEERLAAADRTGNTKQTPEERAERAMRNFKALLEKHLGVGGTTAVRTCEGLFTAI